MHTVTQPENKTELSELAVSLAVLVLADSGKEVTKDNIDAIVAASGISDVSPIFSAAFSNAVAGQDLNKFLAGPKPGAGAAPAAAATTSSSSSSAAVEAPKEEKKVESEADVGAGGLFGDGDGGDDY